MRAWIMAAAVAATPAGAAPVYLDCIVHQSSRELEVNITLDEGQQRATITSPSSTNVAARPAAFSPGEVRIPDGFQTWLVDRSTLKLRQLTNLSGLESEDNGECKLAAPPAGRKF